MPSSFIASGGIDLDDVFEPRSGSDPKANATGFVTSDQEDLSERYLPIASGSLYPNDTGFVYLNSDIRNIFAAKGSTNGVDFSSMEINLIAQVAANQAGQQVFAEVQVVFNPNGTTYQYTLNSLGGDGSISTPLNAVWHNGAPNTNLGSDYEMYFDLTNLSITENSAVVEVTVSTTTYQQLSTLQSITIRAETVGNSGNDPQVDGNFVVYIRKISTGAVVSQQFNVAVAAISI